MKLAIVTDSTCDLTKEDLARLDVRAVPLYVSFQGKTVRDWLEIVPADIVAGVAAGAELPSTSQPSPEDFAAVYRELMAAGHDAILVLTLSAELSGTFQSATLAAPNVEAEVKVFDSRSASMGLGAMVRSASAMRANGAAVEAILAEMAVMRDSTFVLFTVASLEYLQKGGRIGRASAMLGSLLNLKPVLTLADGRIEPVARARGTRKAIQEMVVRFGAFVHEHAGESITVDYIHVLDSAAADAVRHAVEAAGIEARDLGNYEIGAVLATHTGPGAFGLIARREVT